MKKLALIFLVILVLIPIEARAWRDVEVFTAAWADTLATGTTADTIYSGWMNIEDYDYVAVQTFLDVTSGGGAGAGALYVQGRISSGTNYENLWFINMSDSMEIVTSEAISSTADLTKTFLLSMQPSKSLKALAEAAEDTEDIFVLGNYLPYDEIRVMIIDTNWNAAVDVSGKWIFKKD